MEDKKILFQEIDKHLMNDEKPSRYFYKILNDEYFFKEYPFDMIAKLTDISQSPKYHPEGSVWNHAMLVVDNAAQRKGSSKYPRAFMWGALLHDIGKPPTTRVRKGKITSYDHDIVGSKMAREFLQFFNEEEKFIEVVTSLVRWHMQALFVVKDLPFADVKKMVSEVDIDEIALLTLCDRLGRGSMTEDKISEEEENIKIFIRKCKECIAYV